MLIRSKRSLGLVSKDHKECKRDVAVHHPGVLSKGFFLLADRFLFRISLLHSFLPYNMDPSQPTTIAAPRPVTSSSNLCFEIIRNILFYLPRTIVDSGFELESDSNLMCSEVCMNWLVVSRQFALWNVERNSGWPRMNSTRSLVLKYASGL
jgi:hypothetical protein